MRPYTRFDYNSLFLFLPLRQKIYGFYILFLVTAISLTSTIDGTFQRFITPNDYNSAIVLKNFMGVALATCYSMFVYHALEGLPFIKRYQSFYRALLYYGCVAAIYNASVPDKYTSTLVTQTYSGVVMVANLVVIILSIVKKAPAAKYILIAESLTLTGANIYMLQMHDILPVNGFTLWSLHIGFLGECICLSLAVAERTNIEILEKLKAQEQAVNQERETVLAHQEALAAKTKMLATEQMATNAKNAFLSVVCHEVRTPLNHILGNADLLRLDDSMNAGSQNNVTKIIGSSKRLQEMFENFIALSDLESHQLKLHLRGVDLNALLKSTFDKFRSAAEAKSLKYTTIVQPGLPETLLTDANRVKQILEILIDNAIKFTEVGDVSIIVNYDAYAEKLIVVIKDTGIGLSENSRRWLFEPFKQEDMGETRSYEGLGLNLALAKRLTELFDGELTAASVEGKGCSFIVSITAKEANDSQVLGESA